jgi:hypothetical protein
MLESKICLNHVWQVENNVNSEKDSSPMQKAKLNFPFHLQVYQDAKNPSRFTTQTVIYYYVKYTVHPSKFIQEEQFFTFLNAQCCDTNNPHDFLKLLYQENVTTESKAFQTASKTNPYFFVKTHFCSLLLVEWL